MGRVFTAAFLLFELVGGVGLALIAEGLLQGLLGQALGGEFAGQAGDGGGLASVALLGGLQALLGQFGASLGSIEALGLKVDHQQHGDRSGADVEPGARAHAARSWCCSANSA
ncbi:hypothetical protein [Stutzerimonas nitrititolerans]|uniref:hypothetical protein n=1 Tax=Stutzerimonas nitrititolerans TaxID=2482751 RepID=UPI00289BA7D0|nr:hypothetical protein [Stutzerimonas nitrititolerans]